MKKIKDKTLFVIQGNYLRELRKLQNKSQVQVSNEVGKSKQWLSDIENGKNDIFYSDLVKILKCYDVDLNTATKELNRRMFGDK